MKLLDVNLLIYAYNADAPQHVRAKEWLEQVFSSPERVGIPIETVTAFLRITTNRRILKKRLSMEQAIAVVDSWLALPQVELVLPSDRYWKLLRRTLLQSQASGDLVPNAMLAASALDTGSTLYTNDRGFSMFADLRWENPLVRR